MAGTTGRTATFEVKISKRFNISNPDPRKYRGYAVVGKSSDPDVMPGDTIIVDGYSDIYIDANMKFVMTGEFERVNTWQGRSYRVYKIGQAEPAADYRALVAYFKSSRFKGIGAKRAMDIVGTLGLNCLQKIQDDPGCLDAIPSLTDAMRQDILTHVGGTDIEILIRKICPVAPQKFLDYMNEQHAKDGEMILRTNPYVLLDERSECKEITFDIIDRIGRAMNAGMTSEHRIRYGVRYVTKDLADNGLRSAGSHGGNSFINLSDPVTQTAFRTNIMQYLNLPWDVIERHIMDGTAGVRLITCYGPGGTQIVGCYLSEMLAAETLAGAVLRSALGSKSVLDGVSGKELNKAILDYDAEFCTGAPLVPEQMMAVRTALTNRVSVLTGGPGSGKTTVLRGVIRVWQTLCEANGIRPKVVLAAPTGMAVLRMNEAVSDVKDAFIGDKAITWHSTGDSETVDNVWMSRTIASYVCATKPSGSRKPGTSWVNGYATTQADAMRKALDEGRNTLAVIDETSMVCLENFAEFLSLIPKAQLLFVGDTDQLPSIESGEVFLDMCGCGKIPVSRLTINHRSKNAVAIAENAMRIHDGRTDLVTDPGTFDMEFHTHEDQAMLDAVMKAYFSELSRTGRVQDVALLVPKNRKGVCCVAHMNTLIRDLLNPWSGNSSAPGSNIDQTGDEVLCASHYDAVDGKAHKLRIGDRVVITNNNCASSGGMVVNGDRGILRACYMTGHGREREYCLELELDDGRTVTIAGEKLKYVELAYATTVHKAQGCEYASVIFVAQGGMCFEGEFATRNLIYTACTRAKLHCRVIGLKQTVDYCIQHPRARRASMLPYRISGMMRDI